jgi:4'-phosphopantetheinyl transferase
MPFVALPSPEPCRLWRVDLDLDPAAEGLAMLSDDEWARARRFAFERDRRRFLAAHAALRQLLSQHTDLPGASLSFVHGRFGKPTLEGHAGGVRFNLTHSGPIALIACHPDADIGVDVEQLRHMPDAQAMAEAHFTAPERAALAALAGEARDRAFLQGWTRKEACLKAMGLGLDVDTRSFDVGIGCESRCVAMPAALGGQRIALSSFALGATVLGALATVAARAPVAASARATPHDRELCA